MYTNAQVIAVLSQIDRRLAAIEARSAIVAAPASAQASAEIVVPERGAKVATVKVGCTLHAGKAYATGTDATKGIAFHRTWCKGENV